jgi:hypothetical protein
LLTLAALSAGCKNTTQPYRLEMMPPPAIYRSGVVAVPDIRHRELVDGLVQVPYATPRAVAGADDSEPFYLSGRGTVPSLRLADVRRRKQRAGGASDAREPADGPVQLPLRAEVEGSARRCVRRLLRLNSILPRSGPGNSRFIDRRCSWAGPGHHIYVHGYKVVFECDHRLRELWHYLDYEGAFIAPGRLRLAVWHILATWRRRRSRLSRCGISSSTSRKQRRRNGSTSWATALERGLSCLHLLGSPCRDSIRARRSSPQGRIGHVVLIGSEMDRGLLGLTLTDGVLDTVDDVTVYVSANDKVLAIPRRLFGRERAGETFSSGSVPEAALAWLREHPNLSFVDVTDAAESAAENGHRYFRKSP